MSLSHSNIHLHSVLLKNDKYYPLEEWWKLNIVQYTNGSTVFDIDHGVVYLPNFSYFFLDKILFAFSFRLSFYGFRTAFATIPHHTPIPVSSIIASFIWYHIYDWYQQRFDNQSGIVGILF